MAAQRFAERSDPLRLLEFVLECSGAWILAHGDEPLSTEALVRFEVALERRARGEPVAYVTGQVGFYGREFAVTPAVLVPRPETEHLVSLALEHLRARSLRQARVCDVGTGSGILAVTLACELPDPAVVALDVSAAALAVAEANARAHGVAARIGFACGDLFAPLEPDERFDCIVTNLPYVASGDMRPRPDPTAFEPQVALDGGPDGLRTYARFLREAPQRLAPGAFMLMEAGPATALQLAALAREAFGIRASVEVTPDYARLERVVRVLT